MLGGVQGHVHRTWANTYTSFPELYFQPSSVAEVQEICKTANDRHINVVAAGSRHSPSTIALTSGWLLNLDKLDKVLEFKKGDGFTDVRVEGGIRLRDMNSLLANRGLALQNLGSISDQSIAGVISTGTHGSSYCHGLISEQIVSLDMVTANGDIVTASETENKDLFAALLLGLGAFGVIVRATVRCVPAFNLLSRSYVLDFDELLSTPVWDRIFLEKEFHRIWWYPYANKCRVWQAGRTTQEVRAAPYSFYGTRLGRLSYEFLLWLTVKICPRWTPFVEKWLFRNQFDEGCIEEHVDRSDVQINMDCLFKQFVNEWSLPLTEGPEALRELRSEIFKQKWFVHAPIEIRASNTTLPSSSHSMRSAEQIGAIYGNTTRPLLDPSPKLPYAPPGQITNAQLTLNLNATMYRPFMCDPPIVDWYAHFEEICDSHGGRPHWAKIFTANPWKKHTNVPTVEQWKAQRRCWDPQQVFGSTKWLAEKGLADNTQ